MEPKWTPLLSFIVFCIAPKRTFGTRQIADRVPPPQRAQRRHLATGAAREVREEHHAAAGRAGAWPKPFLLSCFHVICLPWKPQTEKKHLLIQSELAFGRVPCLACPVIVSKMVVVVCFWGTLKVLTMCHIAYGGLYTIWV